MPSKSTILQTHVVANPYPPAKEIKGRETLCETCDRVIPTKNWGEHERSKRHREAKNKANQKETQVAPIEKSTEDWANDQPDNATKVAAGTDVEVEGKVDAWVGAPAESGEWGSTAAATENGFGDEGFTPSSGYGNRSGGGRGGRAGGAAGDGNDNCHKCGNPGHFARDCSQVDTCRKCGNEGHYARDCTEVSTTHSAGGGGRGACHNCGEEGHFSRECPQDRKPRGGGSSCYNCMNEGHLSRDCPLKQDGRACYNCSETGHLASECTNPRKPRERDPRGPKCFNCGGYGHKKDACPEQAGAGDSYGNDGFNNGGFDNGGFGDAPATTEGEWASDDHAALATTGGW